MNLPASVCALSLGVFSLNLSFAGEGQDDPRPPAEQYGEPLRLRDLRGQVVLLYFWMEL